jgi:methyl-accepting chemotaxis protein
MRESAVSDIVERLRREADQAEPFAVDVRLIAEAADEIEKLRNSYNQAVGAVGQLTDTVLNLSAEIGDLKDRP